MKFMPFVDLNLYRVSNFAFNPLFSCAYRYKLLGQLKLIYLASRHHNNPIPFFISFKLMHLKGKKLCIVAKRVCVKDHFIHNVQCAR